MFRGEAEKVVINVWVPPKAGGGEYSLEERRALVNQALLDSAIAGGYVEGGSAVWPFDVDVHVVWDSSGYHAIGKFEAPAM